MNPGEFQREHPPTGSELLEAGRQAFLRSDWTEAYSRFSAADQASTLAADDLWSLAVTAAMLGRDDEFFRDLERAFDAYHDKDQTEEAVRCAFWLGMRSLMQGEMGRGSGWLARAQRLLERDGLESAQQGYLLLPTAERQLAQGDFESSFETAAEALDLAERFGDNELLSLALHIQGRARVKQARVSEGLALLDEAMLTVSSSRLFPPLTGVVYCGLIATCRSIYELGRAQEWTASLSDWCSRQQGLVAFAGRCLVHRSEILQLHGAWQESLAEARKAWERDSQGVVPESEAAGPALYQQGDVLRLMGEYSAAEEAFRQALAFGHEPQPGLALLRLAQGKAAAGRAALSRTLAATSDPLKRARLLPAYLELLLELGEREEAQSSCAELSEIAQAFGTPVLATLATQSLGALEVARGDFESAVTSLRKAGQGWQQFDAPFEAAKVRVLLGIACRELGDHDTANLELEAARKAFEVLGAAPDLARVESILGTRAIPASAGLSGRELQVLRLVARGDSNKSIAAQLDLSERTIHRHVSNIFVKLEVSSRAAATAFAYEHGLI